MKNITPLPRELKRKIVRRVIGKVIVMLVLYALFYYAFVIRLGYHYGDLPIGSRLVLVLIYAVLAIVPPFIVGLPQMLRVPSFEGEVLAVDRKNQLKGWAGGISAANRHGFRPEEFRRVVYATVRRRDGTTVRYPIRKYEMDDLSAELCTAGDMVRYYRGTRSGQIFKREGRHDTECIMCGMYTPIGDDCCPRCGSLIVKNPPPFPRETAQDMVQQTQVGTASVPSYTVDTFVPCDVPVTASGVRYSAPVPQEKAQIDYDAPVPEHKEKYRRRVDPMDTVIFFGQTALSYIITSYITLNARGAYTDMHSIAVLYLIISGLIPAAFSAWVMRTLPEVQYREGRGAWLGQALRFLLPAELLRALLSFVPISYNAFGGFFSPLARLAWEVCYVTPSGRADQIAEQLYIAADYRAYLGYALAEFAVRMVVLLGAYLIFWQIHARERSRWLSDIRPAERRK